MKRILTFAVGAAGVAGVALVCSGLARRHRRVAAVAPELRHPLLYVPASLTSDDSLRAGRRLFDETAKQAAALLVDGVEVREERVPASGDDPAVRALVYERADRVGPTGALVWFHGGGFVMGSPEQDAPLSSRFADEAGVLVVSVDYRLAPEHPFPAGLDDGVRALRWVHEHAADLGVDPSRIAIGGESAGGGLAACVAQVAHDRGDLPVCFQLLQYPMLDDRTTRRDVDALLWTKASNRYAWAAYLGRDPSEAEDRPYASAARRVELGGLPPAWIGVGSIDLFHDECVAYAERLRAAGVPVDLHVVPGMYHGAEAIRPEADAMRDFTARMVRAATAAIGPVAAPT